MPSWTISGTAEPLRLDPVNGLGEPATVSSEVSIAPAGLDCTVTRGNGNSVSFFVGSPEWLSWVQAGLLGAALAIFGGTLGATILRAQRESG